MDKKTEEMYANLSKEEIEKLKLNRETMKHL